jgi:hypothetical protein
MMSADLPSYEDDATISNDAQLWRRIPPWHLVLDKNFGRIRPSSAAFDDDPEGTPMSVALGDDVLAAGREPVTVLAGHDDFFLASVRAALARSLKQGIVRRPTQVEPAHAEVLGRKTDSVRRKFARAAVWVIAPSDDSG